LLIAVALTSVFRRRLGYRAWRATHWLAYASWPVALLHGLGTGQRHEDNLDAELTGACLSSLLLRSSARATCWNGRSTGGCAGDRDRPASRPVPVWTAGVLAERPVVRRWMAKRAGTPSIAAPLHKAMSVAPFDWDQLHAGVVGNRANQTARKSFHRANQRHGEPGTDRRWSRRWSKCCSRWPVSISTLWHIRDRGNADRRRGVKMNPRWTLRLARGPEPHLIPGRL